jgi:hypothetical protein
MKKIHEFNIQIHLTNHVVYRDMQACIWLHQSASR